MLMTCVQEVERLKNDKHLLSAIKETVIYVLEILE